MSAAAATSPKGLVFVTPLAHWSGLVQATADLLHVAERLHLQAGKALASSMDGKEPYPATIHELRRLVGRVGEVLDEAANMRAARPADPPKAAVGDFE